MPNFRTIGTLLLMGCTPATPSDAKGPHEADAPAATNAPAVGSNAPGASVFGEASAATLAPYPSGAPAETSAQGRSTMVGPATAPAPPTAAAVVTPALTTPAPLLDRLAYHALPQTQLGFYAVLTPPGYDAPENVGRRYPVVVILHGNGSNEMIHGSLADDFGREDVIYVLPRAPYPSPEQFAAGKQGFTAWPVYPVPWGQYDAPSFPKTLVDRLQVHKYYTRWIAECVLDARSRYRMTQNRAVVVGHSQGAAFAHLFAADYPALVRAYAAYAGPSHLVVNSHDGPRQLASLRSAAIVPMLIHHEGDTIVDVGNTKALDAMMTQYGVKHVTHVLPGGTHATDPEVRRLLRSFTREHCCGKERTTADIPTSPNVELSVPPAPDTVTFGPDTCDEHISAFTRCQNPPGSTARCAVYEAEPCDRRSVGYRSLTFECVNSVWTQVAKSPAECGVQRRDPKISGCNLQLLRTHPSELSKTDRCDLVVRCNGIQSVVACDGENDGTDTSLCECTRNGAPVTLPQSLYPGEAPQSCITAAQQCVTR
jgi:predicted esterase